MNFRPISPQTLTAMREAFFEVSPDGVLVYLDPTIGPLQSRKHQLAVTVNPATNQLELKFEGVEVQSFELRDNVSHICQEAAVAYFTAIEKLCQRRLEPAVA